MDTVVSPERIHNELLHCVTLTQRSIQKSAGMETVSRTCCQLAADIFSHSYTPSPYTRFAVTDPKLREIYAPAFRDRLAQNWLVYHLSPFVERVLIDDTYANRCGKGVLAAVKRAQTFMRRPGNQYYLQLDVQNFFNSIPHAALLRQCRILITRYMSAHPLRTQILDMLEKSVQHAAPANTFTISGDRLLLDSIPAHKTLLAAGPGRGLPLGSASSQMLAGLYMNPLDQYIKHTLRVKGYVRYMDDLILFGNSTAQLSRYRQAIRYFMQTELELTLHPHKQTLQACHQGADYLGYRIYPHYLHLRKRNITKLVAWMRFFNSLLSGTPGHPPTHIAARPEWMSLTDNGSLSPDLPLLQRMQAVINSYYGMMKHATHFRLRRDIWYRHGGMLTTYMLPDGPQYTSVRIKKRCLQDWILSRSLPVHTG
ncbi:RNA-directed DNA polymerase [Enterobacter sp. SLBN-59]|uniref:RNA-directed DNA polymerase n=1 Tax=Enterobacter sp. SLBN-59 TaxID=2940621 RepID=UPI002168BFC1|nr:RNA-directed DNA polymerase [Enterobacter sp. SLBN-59]MCS3491023.1 hypothetical protein [Enterobacter sp. SLBN-59]